MADVIREEAGAEGRAEEIPAVLITTAEGADLMTLLDTALAKLPGGEEGLETVDLTELDADIETFEKIISQIPPHDVFWRISAHLKRYRVIAIMMAIASDLSGTDADLEEMDENTGD